MYRVQKNTFLVGRQVTTNSRISWPHTTIIKKSLGEGFSHNKWKACSEAHEFGV